MPDRIDRMLLNLLQADADRTNAQLAAEIGLAPSTCLRRIRRLKRGGIIERIVAVLNPAKAGRSLRAVVTVELAAHGAQDVRRFLDRAVREDAVAQAYAVTGQVDAVLILRLADMDEFDALCERLFREGTGVSRFFSMMVMRTAKDETAIPLEP